MYKSVSIIAVYLLLIAMPMAKASSGLPYPLQQVAEGIYFHQGLHEEANKSNFGAIANVGFITGDKCVAVIDSGGSYTEGKLLLNAIRRQTDKPICYVINTHVHPDHLLGNAAFKDEQPIFISHEKLPAALDSRKDRYARDFSQILGEAYTGTEFNNDYTTVTGDAPLMLDLGDREIELTAYTTAHTDHDLTILDHKTRTLWTGDLLFRERIPALDGSINGWIETLKGLQAQQFNAVIPGHGPVSHDNSDAGWTEILRYLTLIRAEIRELIEEVATIEQAIETVGLSEKTQWELFKNYHRRNVTAAFVELEWE